MNNEGGRLVFPTQNLDAVSREAVWCSVRYSMATLKETYLMRQSVGIPLRNLAVSGIVCTKQTMKIALGDLVRGDVTTLCSRSTSCVAAVPRLYSVSIRVTSHLK
jgi:hypothetical protein